MRIAVALVVAAATLAPPAHGDAPPRWSFLPLAARAVPRRDSASRDAPAIEASYGPRAAAQLGLDLGLIAFRAAPGATLRLGTYGVIALENVSNARAFPPNELWRGLVGASTAASFERAFGAGSTLELAATFGHESDHADYALVREDATLARALLPKRGGILQKAGGELWEFVALDVAARLRPAERWVVTARLTERVGVHGLLTHAPSADLHLRFLAHPAVQPVLAIYGETLVPRAPGSSPAAAARLLAGVAFPGALAEITVFGALETGAGKGLLLNTRSDRVSVGLRIGLF